MDANRERLMRGGYTTHGGTEDAPSIKLRYSMQFTSGGRSHTIEMEVPVPVGASQELREQLIREAEANMEQLYRRVESRARGQRPPDAVSRSSAAPSPASSSPSYTSPAAPTAPTAQSQPSPVSSPVREILPLTMGREQRASVPAPAPARAAIGAELPVTPGQASAGSGNMKLSEFIQVIRTNWGLNAKQVMDLLQVKSLNNMNYRDLLRQLEPLVAPQRDARPAPPAPREQPRAPSPLPTQASPLAGPANIPVYPLRDGSLREPGRSYRFEEEEDEQDSPGNAQTTEDEEEEAGGMSLALARIKTDELRDIRGNTLGSPGRIVVLHNLMDTQLSEAQFQQLIELLWDAPSDKKLKQDQVEALISWAKEDEFENEVRAVMAVLREQ